MTMLEKMARAMYECSGKRDTELYGAAPRCAFDEFKGKTWDGRDHWYAMAAAALDALMEPTEEMIALDRSLGSRWDHTFAPPMLYAPLGSHTGASFQDMIRAAKAGK